MTDPLRAIRTRRAEIVRERARIEEEDARLKTEDEKLAIAEQVMIEYGAAPDSSNQAEIPKARGRKALARSPKKVKAGIPTQKPAGIPKMTDMIIRALQDASEHGRVGITPTEVRKFIEQRWWPGVPQSAVGPIVWRLAKDGKIAAGDGFYSLKNETPAVQPAEASESGVASTTPLFNPPTDKGIAAP